MYYFLFIGFFCFLDIFFDILKFFCFLGSSFFIDCLGICKNISCIFLDCIDSLHNTVFCP